MFKNFLKKLEIALLPVFLKKQQLIFEIKKLSKSGKKYKAKAVFDSHDKLCLKKITETEVTGSGVKIITSVSEMIGRLILLIMSIEAGNVGAEIDNQIIDILDHLRSKNLLTSDE